MSPGDGYQDEAEEGDGVSRRLTDEQIEQLLTGQPVADAAELARFVADLAAFADAEIDPELVATHIATAAAAASETGSAVTDHTPGHGRAARLRRRLAFSGFLSSVAAKIVLGTTVALATTAGAAAAGILPDPLQAVAADAASIVGLHIPDPDDTAVVATTSTTTTTSTTAAVTTTSSPTDDEADRAAVTTETTQPEDTATTSTTEPSENESEQSQNGDEQESLDLEGPLATLVGDHTWAGTACDGSALTVTYRVTEDGQVEVAGISPTAQTSTDDHGFTAEFGDVSVEIELKQSDGQWRLRERFDRSCDSSADQASDEPSNGSGDETDGDATEQSADEDKGGDEGSPDNSGTSGDSHNDDEDKGGDEGSPDNSGTSGDSHNDD